MFILPARDCKPAMPYDSGITYDSGATYEDGPIPKGKTMAAQVAYNLDNLDPRQVLQKIKNAHDAVAGHAATFATPNPALATVLTAHNTAEAILDDIDAREQVLVTRREERDAALTAAVQKYQTLGAYVESIADGNPAVVTEGGYDLVQPRAATQPVPKLGNNFVTAGDNDGDGDAGWDSDRKARSYELQTAPAPAGPWVHEATLTVSHHHLTGKPSGQKLWTRVRGVNKLGPGPWSDPACCTIP